MIDESVPVSESVILIANIWVIGISVILHMGASLTKTMPISYVCLLLSEK